MTWQGWLQILIYVAVLTALTPLLGGYMARVYMGRRVVLERALGPVERLFYRAVRTNPAREQDWKQYGTTVLVFSALFWPPSLPLRRRLVALALAGLGLPALTSVLLPLRDQANLSSVLLAYVTLVVAVATIGGWWPAVLAALAASALGSYYSTRPYNTWRINDPDNIVALVVFLLVAVMVSTLVALAERRRHQAERGRSEAEALARLAGSLLGTSDPTTSLLQHLKSTFNQDAAAVFARQDGQWQVQAAVGSPPPDPDQATESVPLSHDAVLALQGPTLPAADRQVLAASAALLSVAVHSHQLAQQVDRIAEQQAANELRRAILDAVSHDLRTPCCRSRRRSPGCVSPAATSVPR